MGFGRRSRPKFNAAAFDGILGGIKHIYREKVRPLEELYMIKDFYGNLLTEDYFEAKPMVLLVGSYSTGKTSFIKYLLESEFPGMHIGPEPTTDGFQAILHGASERQLPGNALVSNPASPFAELSQYGNGFLQRFSGCEVASDFAKACTLIDTPGILAGRKQTEDRNYNFEQVIQWFLPRCEIILLMFDANKVDISDEFKRVIKLLEGYDDKIRVILNKADSLDPSDLLKVNSALTWSLARILQAPEVRRIYCGSFWDQPLQPTYLGPLFEREAASLLHDLSTCPRNNTTTKLNDLLVRARRVKVFALIFHELRSQMPKLGSRDRKQKELIASLEETFLKVQRAHNVPFGDFPDPHKFRLFLTSHEGCRDFTKFKKIDDKVLQQLDAVLREHIPQLMTQFEAIPAGAPPPTEDVSAYSSSSTMPPPQQQQQQQQYEPPPQQQRAPPPMASDPWASATDVTDPWAKDDTVPRRASNGMSGAIDGLFGTSAAASAGAAEEAAAARRREEAEAARRRQAEEEEAAAARQRAAALEEARREEEAAAARRAAAEEARRAAEAATAAAAAAAAPPPPSARDVPWAVSAADKNKFDGIFAQMAPEDGLVGGDKVAPVLKKSGLPQNILREIWTLVDRQKDGVLDADWFAVAMHLAMKTKKGAPLPEGGVLPPELIPPKDR